MHAKNIDVEEYMERVFSLTVGGTLPEPIPLGQMIDILIDSWEADGLFGKYEYTFIKNYYYFISFIRLVDLKFILETT